MNHRTGQVQAAILAALRRAAKEDPLVTPTLGFVRQSVETRQDNVDRSLAILVERGFVDTAGELVSLTPAGAREAEALADDEWQSVVEHTAVRDARRDYLALTRAFALLAERNPLTLEALFPPRAVSRKVSLRLLDVLQAEGLISETANGCYVASDTKKLKATWSNERAFCSILGRECPEEQAAAVHVLMREDAGTLQQQAAAAAFLYDVIGQENTARRTGLSTPRVTALRRIAALGPKVQAAMVKAGVSDRWILGIPPDTPPDKILAELEAEEPAAALDSEEQTAEEGDGDLHSLVATCLKLCAFTAETVAQMEKKIDFLATELGYKRE